ncbi:MAG: 50S ribosomal protein L25 [Desulfobacterales bacterium]|nr:50S ribosomal protein L25 [Desulfobacterales bacterium]
MEKIFLAAQWREGKGKEEARRLRHQGLIPAVVYGQRQETIPVTLNPQELAKVLHGGAGERTLINLTIEGLKDGPITKTVILKEKQIDPLKRTWLHVDLYTIAMDEEISVGIPVRIVGKAAGVTVQGGILEQVLREIEVKCLPSDIPSSIDVDVSSLEIGDSIHVAEITLEKGKILTDPGQTVVTVVAPKEEVVAAVEEVAEGEVAEEAGEEKEEVEEEKGKGEEDKG